MLALILAATIVLPIADASEKPTDDTSQWVFRARVKDYRIVPPDGSKRVGVAYTESAIKAAKDGATLYVGFDAHWLLTLSILDHGNDPLGFKHIKTLNLIIHSPARDLGVDKPKNREFDLTLRYRINDRSEYRFEGLETRQPADSRTRSDSKAVQPKRR